MSMSIQYPLIRSLGIYINIGAVKVRLGFGGILYYYCNKDASKIVQVIIQAPIVYFDPKPLSTP